MKLICRRALLLLMLLCAVTAYSKNNQSLKREFRGAWIQAVNGQFLNMQPDEMRAYLTDMLDNLQLANVNARFLQFARGSTFLMEEPERIRISRSGI